MLSGYPASSCFLDVGIWLSKREMQMKRQLKFKSQSVLLENNLTTWKWRCCSAYDFAGSTAFFLLAWMIVCYLLSKEV